MWPQVDLYESLSAALGEEITPATPREHLVALCEKDGIEFHPTAVPGKLVEELFEHHVVPTFTGPTFVMDYPVDTSPLVRGHRTKPGVVEKWDLYINGAESGTGYSELVDPVIQRERLVEQAALGARGDVEAMHLDEDFLRAMEHGMPPMGGVGVGIDRVLMALTGLGIRETILFPLVKPEQRGHERDQSRARSMARVIRPARTQDVRAIRGLVDFYSPDGRLLSKATVTLFEDVQEFLVAERDGEVVGCGALHVMWEDLAEVRTVAVDPALAGQGIGSLLLTALIERARELGVSEGVLPDLRRAVLRAARLHGDRRLPGRPRRLRAAAAVLRRGRRGVPRPRAGEAEHPGQPPDAGGPVRRLLLPVVAVALALGLAAAPASATAPAAPDGPLAGRLILLDPGHQLGNSNPRFAQADGADAVQRRDRQGLQHHRHRDERRASRRRPSPGGSRKRLKASARGRRAPASS